MSDRRRRPGTRGALVLLLLGVICLGAGVLLDLYGSEDRAVLAQDVGSVPGSAVDRSRPLGEDIAAPPAGTPVVPGVLELPARGVTAPVDAVGTDPSGGMVIPEQVRTVGWWAPGVLPGGSTGSAVISGHVDSRTQGVGVLSVLPQLTEGEPVLVRDAAGRTAAFRVAARREYAKYDLPRAVFSRGGPAQLVLITCGGRFDPAARSYESNIVVYAVPDATARTDRAAPSATALPPPDTIPVGSAADASSDPTPAGPGG